MAEITEIEIDAAVRRGKILSEVEPRAQTVHYSGAEDRIVINLTNGTAFSFPPRLVQGLEVATPAQIASVEILGNGYGLHWEELDVDFTVAGLIAGIFGTRTYMARQAGQVRSAAKTAAARANGAKGGRPRKIAKS